MNIPDMINYMDKVINQMENPQLMIDEVKKRDAEAEKERQHRIDEDLEADRREEARIENLEYRDECRKERDEYWEPNEL